MGNELCQHSLAYDLRLCRFNENNAEQPAYFAGIYVFRAAVFGNVLPQAVVLKIIHCVRRADADIVRPAPVVRKGTRLGLFKRAHGLAYFVHGKGIG